MKKTGRVSSAPMLSEAIRRKAEEIKDDFNAVCRKHGGDGMFSVHDWKVEATVNFGPDEVVTIRSDGKLLWTWP